jgi:hypothetical protein
VFILLNFVSIAHLHPENLLCPKAVSAEVQTGFAKSNNAKSQASERHTAASVFS